MFDIFGCVSESTMYQTYDLKGLHSAKENCSTCVRKIGGASTWKRKWGIRWETSLINQSINQSINPPLAPNVNKSINQSITFSLEQWVYVLKNKALIYLLRNWVRCKCHRSDMICVVIIKRQSVIDKQEAFISAQMKENF